MKFKELEKMLLKDGWILKNSKGSHHQYIHPTKREKSQSLITKAI